MGLAYPYSKNFFGAFDLLICRARLNGYFSVLNPGMGNGNNPLTAFAFQLYPLMVEFCHQLTTVAPGFIVFDLRLNIIHYGICSLGN